MKIFLPRLRWLVWLSIINLAPGRAEAALLAYEPFTNTPGTAIIGSSDGFGFSGSWQANSSGGIATNTAYPLGYRDAAGNTLQTSGGAGFFQGLSSANTSMQPIRLFSFGRGTNGVDGGTTWISFLAVRQGPTAAGNNLYPRGANVPHDIHSGALQKLAIGNSSGAATNTVGLIPQGSSANLKASRVLFSLTNFIVVRIDHTAGIANDNAHLFVNPLLSIEPALVQADTNSLGAFDFSFDRLRVFAGGNVSSSQPYAQLVIDEYRIGDTYADVAPHIPASNPPPADLVITSAFLTVAGMTLSGTGGSNAAPYVVLASGDLAVPAATWSIVSTNDFDPDGNFNVTSPAPAGVLARFYRLLRVAPPRIDPAVITADPVSQSVSAGDSVSFSVTAEGSEPLAYQWFFNTNTVLADETNSTLDLIDVRYAHSGAYSARVSNAGGQDTSVAAILTVFSPPIIMSEPADQQVMTGESAMFSVVAEGSETLHYQWYFNTNTPLSGTAASYSVSNAQNTNAGAYSVLVTNSYGSITSAFARLTVSDAVNTNGAWFVSPDGSDSNPGTIESPFATLNKGLTAAGNGGIVYLRGGAYSQPSKLSLSQVASPTNRIRLWAYPGETPVIDNTGIASNTDGFSISGNGYHFKGLVQKRATHNGIRISGNSNIIERCIVQENGDTGLHISGGQSGSAYPAYNLILNCDAYLNYDPPVGENADGFSAKWRLGPGNVFRGCRAWLNSDDGWDLWMGSTPVLIEDCWAFWSGTNYWNSPSFNGNGNGFKLGGNYVPAAHRLVRSAAFRNQKHGIDQNNNLAGQIVDNNTAWANVERNFNLNHGTNTSPHLVRNNLSIAGGSADSFTAGTLATNNSWQVLSPAASTSDVLSVDVSGALAPREFDGSLPNNLFLRPVPGGRLVDEGIDIGDDFEGAAPDLGAFE